MLAQARTRASRALSTSRLARVTTTGRRRNADPVPDEQSELLPQWHVLPQVVPERVHRSPWLAHATTLSRHGFSPLWGGQGRGCYAGTGARCASRSLTTAPPKTTSRM